ncbi:MAG: hypothetical protein ACI85O_001445 [Saprospiraceae bacterium]|jgi:hypothetical protein
MSQQHVILKFILEPVINDEARHRKIADSISEIVNYRITDILSKKLDECSEPDKLIRFPKIEIDLGEVKEKDLYDVLTKDLPKLIADEVGYKIRTEFIKEEEYKSDRYSYSSYGGGSSYSSDNFSPASDYSNVSPSAKSKPRRTRMLVPQAVMLTKAKSVKEEVFKKIETPKKEIPQLDAPLQNKEKPQSTPAKSKTRTRTIIPQSIGEIPIPKSILEENLRKEKATDLLGYQNSRKEKVADLSGEENLRKEKATDLPREENLGKEERADSDKEEKSLSKEEISKDKEIVEQAPTESKAPNAENPQIIGEDQIEPEQNKKTEIPRSPALSVPVSDKNRPTSIATYHSQIDAIVHFLRTGRLPEWIVLGKVTMDELINRLFDRYPSIIGLRLKQMKDEPNVRIRLTEQFSNAVRERIELATGDTFVKVVKEDASVKLEEENEKGKVPGHLSEIVAEMQDLTRVQSATAPIFDKKQGFKNYLIYLLVHGEKPWWSNNLPDENPENYFFALSEADKKTFLSVILKSIDEIKLEKNFSKRAIEKMWTALYPDMVGFIKTVELSLEKSDLPAQVPIWTYLKRNAGNPFNVNSFVSTVVALTGNIDKIQDFLKTKEEPRFSALQNVLEFLDPTAALLQENILEERIMDKEEIWQTFINSGTSSVSIEDLVGILKDLLDKTPVFVVQSLRQLSKERMASNLAFGEISNAVTDILLKKLLPIRYPSYRKMVVVLRTIKNNALRAHIIDYAVRVPGERFNIQHYLRDFIKMSVRRRMIDPKAVIQELLDELKKQDSYADIRKDIINHLKIINEAVKVSKSLRHQTAVKKEAEKEQEVTHIPYKDGALGEEAYIRNAGIVILWPFLTTYFGRLGMLTEEKEFKDLETASRAVHLLQYLATKFPASEEHELVLNKILCGIPIDTPIEYGITITEAEAEMSDSLLKAVITQWTALKNSSLDGLRGGFLIREGKLTKRKDKWLLQVEKRTYDILLGKMPWGVSMIKISWMPKMLTVEWG